MRTMIPGVLILILWGAVPALAQLPPEIQADSYLLRAEQAIDKSDTARAMVELDKIILLQKEHELDLPDEFHFRHAQAAAAADLAEQALEAVEKYLLAAGREGRHYVEALELMNQVQDAIEASKEPQEASNEPVPEPAQVAKQGPIEDQMDTDGNPEAQEVMRALIVAAESAEAQPAPQCDLEQWRAEGFFRTATVQDVKACLEAGADPNARNEYKSTPLHWAAWNKNPAVIEALLKAGANPMARDEWKNTPLHRAARNKNPAVIEALLKAGADPNARDEYKSTPLHRAAWNKNPAVIEALLKAGANPMARNEWKTTPLHLARNLGKPTVIKALIDAGADARAVLKWTPLHEAAALNEDPAAIEALLKAGADSAALDEDKWTPLHLAAGSNENSVVIEALLKAGADPMARNEREMTPLHLAARNNENPVVIETLLKAGADPMARSESKSTPLHWAARYNENPAVIETLLNSGADPMARSKSKMTPLLQAARYNKNPAVVQALLAAGADTKARDWRKSTPLHKAARYNENPAVVQALLAAGADPNARDWNKNTPLDEAEDAGNSTAIEVLRHQKRTAAGKTRTKKRGGGLGAFIAGTALATTASAAGASTEDAVALGSSVITGQQPAGNSGAGFDPDVLGPTGSTGGTAGGGSCLIPGYPSPPGGVANLGLSWCPASVDFQARAFALQAAGAQCAIATGSSSTPEQIQARRREITAACGRLAALSARGGINCRCPAGYGP